MKIRSKKVRKSNSASGLACVGKASTVNFTGGDIGGKTRGHASSEEEQWRETRPGWRYYYSEILNWVSIA